MTQLTQEFVDQCPEVRGFRQRGMEMTRIEVFVDAAFAFAVTMLVISFDQIPSSFPEMMDAVKGIPAFIAAVAQLVWIWHAHNVWSRRFGLDDAMTVFLSTALLVVVLIYIYPLRVMLQSGFAFFTNGYLPPNFRVASLDELSAMFVFLGIGFFALCAVFVLMYRFAASKRKELLLSENELFMTRTLEIIWMGIAVIALITVISALTFPPALLPFAPFTFIIIGAWMPYISIRREKERQALLQTIDSSDR
jgi:hypothetical protein